MIIRKRQFGFLVVFVAGILIGGSGLYAYLQWNKIPEYVDEGRMCIRHWQFAAGRSNATEALTQWQKLQQYFHYELHQAVDDDEKRLIYRILAEKFLWEDNFKKSFECYLNVPPDDASFLWDLPVFIYLAGLAGDQEWLASWQIEADGGDAALQDLFVRANQLWAQEKYVQLIDITQPEKWAQFMSQCDPRRGYVSWLYFIRAKALMKTGEAIKAYEELSKSVYTEEWCRTKRYPYFTFHIVMQMAEIAIQADKGPGFHKTLSNMRDAIRNNIEDKSSQLFLDQIDKLLQSIDGQDKPN